MTNSKTDLTSEIDATHKPGCEGCQILGALERADAAEAALRATWTALDKANALNPGDYRTGQGHLPPAFREINYRDAFLALIEIVNEIERGSGYIDRPDDDEQSIPPD